MQKRVTYLSKLKSICFLSSLFSSLLFFSVHSIITTISFFLPFFFIYIIASVLQLCGTAVLGVFVCVFSVVKAGSVIWTEHFFSHAGTCCVL